MISGPYDISVIEQLRDETFAPFPTPKRVPTDIFLWNLGEPTQRAVTKIGGLPYREVGKAWPTAPSGMPMNFVAQFCFADSSDLFPPLPGDLLLIFIEGKRWQQGNKIGYVFTWGKEEEQANSALAYEWVSLHHRPLVTQEDIPQTPWQIMPCYGTIYRTWDDPGVDGFDYPDIAEHIPEILEATKIGGACPYEDEVRFRWQPHWRNGPSTYLCTLSSISLGMLDLPFPFLNHPKPFRKEEREKSSPLLIGDVGLMNFFLDGSGALRWTLHH